MSEKQQKLTPLSELGEFGLIDKLSEPFIAVNQSTQYGIGDDAAVLSYENRNALVSTDMLVEGVHFDLAYMPLKHLGYKAVVVNLSDIYAMNGRPEQIVVSIAVSNRFNLEALQTLYEGMKMACDKYKIDLVGGDTTSSQSGLVISVTVMGSAAPDDIVYRKGAQENDLIVLTGDTGAAYMGLQLLEREKAIFKANPDVQPELGGHEYILQRQLRPEAREDIIEILKSLKIKPTAMIDVSDGVSSEIIHIARQSDLGCRIMEDKLPIASETKAMAEELNLDPTICALNGGEDYELLFTIKPEEYDKIKSHPDFTVIGYMSQKTEGYNLVARDNTLIQIKAQGWNALLEKDSE